MTVGRGHGLAVAGEVGLVGADHSARQIGRLAPDDERVDRIDDERRQSVALRLVVVQLVVGQLVVGLLVAERQLLCRKRRRRRDAENVVVVGRQRRFCRHLFPPPQRRLEKLIMVLEEKQ